MALAVLIGCLIAPSLVTASDPGTRYRMTAMMDWQVDREGRNGPDNPHWSRLIAITHTSRYTLFADGLTASSGLALLATNGRVSVLEAELAEARRRNRVANHTVLPGLATGVGTFETEILVTESAPLVSFATMLAPSPDWFSGVGGLSLRDENGSWRSEVTVSMWVWDAGADAGPNFVAPNAETQPRESVRLLAHPAFLRPTGLKPIGTAKFVRLD